MTENNLSINKNIINKENESDLEDDKFNETNKIYNSSDRNNSISEEINEDDNSDEESCISENEMINEYRKPKIYVRLLKEEKNLKYKNIINSLTKNKKYSKKHALDDDEEIDEILKMIDITKKKKLNIQNK